MNLLVVQFHLRHQTSDALLEIAVLGGVDERVDAAVGVHQCHGEVIEPTEPEDSLREEIKSVESVHLTELIVSQINVGKTK